MRRFVAYVQDGKVGVAVSDEHNDENAENIGFTEHFFSNYEEIDRFAAEHPDLPDDVKQDAYNLQKQAQESSVSAAQPLLGPTEAKYSMLARHGELDTMLAAGKTPGADYFKDLAQKDRADFAKLDAAGRLAVTEDMKRAANASSDYAEGVQDTGALADGAEKELTLSGEELGRVKRRMAMNGGSVEVETDGRDKNKMQVKRTGKELEEESFLKPTTIARDYEQVGLEYRLKNSNSNLVFREAEGGNSLHTASTDKKIIGDMVAMAKAKGWSNIKLTGSQEFRREAWLQSESQGIKTTGYTPRAEDLEVLDALKKQRRENGIANVDVKEKSAPRTAANATEATLQTSAKLNITQHLEALSARPEFKGYGSEQLAKIAELRSLYAEDLKQSGKEGADVDAALNRFDKHVSNPERLAEFYKATESLQERSVPERKAVELEQSR